MSLNDELGDRMKAYEDLETSRRFMPGLPVYARIDGRGFSKFTRDMDRPFDKAMTECMIYTTEVLVEKTHATIGYTQSDEISLAWTASAGQNWFGGKTMKMSSVLAGLATSAFINGILEFWSFARGDTLIGRMPHFDTRVITMPNLEETANMLLWRNLDATKNAISMAASHYYSHNELHKKNGSDKNEMLFQKGINFDSYPPSFKRGTWVRREVVDVILTDEQRNAILEAHRPAVDATVKRNATKAFDLPPLTRVKNKVDVLFSGAEPEKMD